MTYHHRDRDNDLLTVSASTDNGQPVLLFVTTPAGVNVPLDRVEELVAGIREAVRQAGTRQPEHTPNDATASWNRYDDQRDREKNGSAP